MNETSTERCELASGQLLRVWGSGKISFSRSQIWCKELWVGLLDSCVLDPAVLSRPAWLTPRSQAFGKGLCGQGEDWLVSARKTLVLASMLRICCWSLDQGIFKDSSDLNLSQKEIETQEFRKRLYLYFIVSHKQFLGMFLLNFNSEGGIMEYIYYTLT